VLFCLCRHGRLHMLQFALFGRLWVFREMAFCEGADGDELEMLLGGECASLFDEFASDASAAQCVRRFDVKDGECGLVDRVVEDGGCAFALDSEALHDLHS
jgi:hypothetical protein